LFFCSANFVVVVRGIVFIVVVVLGKVDDTGVDVIADNSSVGSLQWWGCDGHGSGLLLLLSWTTLHIVSNFL